MSRYRAWTDSEIAALLRAHADGLSVREISERIGRQHTSIRKKLAAFGKRANKRGPLWTTDADDALRRLYAKGMKYKDIAHTIGKTESQCSHRAQKLEITKPRYRRSDDSHAVEENPPKDRPCLKCGSIFSSEWSGNRLCRPCAESNRRVFGSAAEDYAVAGR